MRRTSAKPTISGLAMRPMPPRVGQVRWVRKQRLLDALAVDVEQAVGVHLADGEAQGGANADVVGRGGALRSQSNRRSTSL
jgi:hypothetical protein